MSHQETAHLLNELQKSHGRRPFRLPPRLDGWVFGFAAVLAVSFVIWGFAAPAGLGSVASSMLDWTVANLGWLFVIAAAFITLFILVVALSRRGRIPLGRNGEAPEYRTISWISMMFATGMGIGLVFYGVGEPLYFYMFPPPDTVTGQTPEAGVTAMGTALFHWSLFPWSMYALVGLGVAYSTFRLGRTQLFSSMFESLFGRSIVNGPGGRAINILAILATLFGSACSLGLGALQIGGGIVSAGFMDSVGSSVLIVIIAILTACFVASAVSGISRGIQWLSNINMVLALLLAVLVFIGGPTLFILNVIPQTIGNFVGELPHMASRTASDEQPELQEWMAGWTVFYWAWFISWTPFVGIFIARISRGRTIRQFVVGILLVPSAVSLLWLAVFGGGAIGLQERAERAGNTVDMLSKEAGGGDINFDTVLFDMFEQLGLPGVVLTVVTILTVALIAIFFITGADSASIVMGGLSENGAVDPSRKTVIFWGTATGAVAAAMLLAGGDDPSEALNGLKNITIVSSVPFLLVLLLLCVSLWRDLSRDPMVIHFDLARVVLENSAHEAVEEHGGKPFIMQSVEAEYVEDPTKLLAEGDLNRKKEPE
ncbi:BCCT family transporter [Corynebacterium terpenotabidum]|uniref:Choline/carnitine/betaine transport n=1 Tax=Corynebacterium terpenotabidum Y-11 TaxID=1200352 RepID=S4XCB2_9CORY|nr:BCCT family transporter [Corynebacterium terpenotabidum]AGP30129.1 choline/carnitine/betaine transport [Corynebacterium terpenotabidum Y-11]